MASDHSGLTLAQKLGDKSASIGSSGEDYARTELALRRDLAQILAKVNLPCDPALDILLEVYSGMQLKRKRTPSDVAIGAGIALSSATRWIKTMEQKNLIERFADPNDGRRVYLSLTQEALRIVEQVISLISHARNARVKDPNDQVLFFRS